MSEERISTSTMSSFQRFIRNLLRSNIVRLVSIILVLYFIYLYYASVPKPSFRNSSEMKNDPNPQQTFGGEIEGASAAKDVQQRQKTNIDNDHVRDKPSQRNVLKKPPLPKKIDVMVLFSNAKQNNGLQEKFKTCVLSILRWSSVDIAFHIIGDGESQKIGKSIIDDNAGQQTIPYTIEHHDVDKLAKALHEIVKPMQDLFSYKPGAYYSDAIFFLSIAIHKVMPKYMSKVIMLDADLKFRTDIVLLYEMFFQFADSNVIGIARDQQPVYRHTFWQYRRDHPKSRVGEPPPNGLTGFNSGVLLLDLQRMRNSLLYNKLINKDEVTQLTQEFSFKGHLGDQDFFTLVNMKHEELFYVLPCTWNRQLCIWWKDKGYADVFDSYHKCDGEINVYHGNCNTHIPDV